MTATINASTSSGIIQTADTSGDLALQSNGTTKLTVSSTGATITALTVSGATTVSSSGITFSNASTQTVASPFSKSFVSSNQSIPTASGQTFTVAHGLGVVPKILRLVAVCLTAQYGWTVGAEGEITMNGTTNGNLQNIGVLADVTNVYYAAGSGINIINNSSGDNVSILNNSNFALKIYAYA